jgi:tetratricopeptide (TPR) repeat protein
MVTRALIVIVCALLAFAPLAHAQPTDARALSEQAKTAFDRGDFADAAKLLEEAYRLKPWPVLLYNLGRAYQQAGNKARAVDAYERYLVAQPDARDAGAVRESIRQLNEQIARDRELEKQATTERERASAEAAAKQRALEDAERARRAASEAGAHHKPSPVPWIIGGIGVAGLATGFVFGGLSMSSHAAAVADTDAARALADQNSAQTYALVANVLFIAGGTIALASVIWGIFDVRASSAATARVRAAFGPTGFVLRAEF